MRHLERLWEGETWYALSLAISQDRDAGKNPKANLILAPKEHATMRSWNRGPRNAHDVVNVL